jgi:hypothetical protein
MFRPAKRIGFFSDPPTTLYFQKTETLATVQPEINAFGKTCRRQLQPQVFKMLRKHVVSISESNIDRQRGMFVDPQYKFTNSSLTLSPF